MTRFFFWCYPWDLADEGVEAAIGRMAGEINVDALSVAATCCRVKEFRARAFGAPRMVEHGAAAHFQPDKKRYLKTRILPNPAPWMKTRNALEKIGREAEKSGLKLRVSAVCCRSDALVSRYPMASCVDAFGDASRDILCPSNPDVREYVASLVDDLSGNYPVDTVELLEVGFGSDAMRRGEEACGFFPDPARWTLGSWCFCPSCRQRASNAGIDVEAVFAVVTEHLAQMLRVEPAREASFEVMLTGDEGLAAYHRMRVETVTSLVEGVRSRTDARVVLHAGADVGMSGEEPSALAGHCDGFILPCVQSHVDSADAYMEAVGGPSRIELMLRCHPPTTPDSDSLVQEVHQLAQRGCGGIGFWNYGMVPEPCLEWVRRAVRFARREVL